jgi:hypothetical protein
MDPNTGTLITAVIALTVLLFAGAAIVNKWRSL